jgi:septal ring factor EnvC (AmiA/AmiB activator)
MLELEIINLKKINETTNADLMTQIVEAKKKEEAHKIQITKKKESFQMFEREAIKLKRIQIEYEEEIKILKTKVFDLTKVMEELEAYDKTIKCKEVSD